MHVPRALVQPTHPPHHLYYYRWPQKLATILLNTFPHARQMRTANGENLKCKFDACKPGTGTPLAYTIPTSHTPNSFALTEAFIRLLGCCGSVLWFVANLRSKSAWSISVPGALTSWASLPSYDFASAMSAALIPRLAKDFRTRKSCFWSGVGMMLPTECFEMPQRRT